MLDQARDNHRPPRMGNGRIGGGGASSTAWCFSSRRKSPKASRPWRRPWSTWAGHTSVTWANSAGSHWLFQIAQADVVARTNATPRTAMDIYEDVLRDPQPADWSSDPMESLAVLVTPHPLPYEHWFGVALARKDQEAAIEIGDRMRRHRFFTSMAFGGRLESLRWVLEAPGRYARRPATSSSGRTCWRGIRPTISFASRPTTFTPGWRPCRWRADDSAVSRKQAAGAGRVAGRQPAAGSPVCVKWRCAASRREWSSRPCASTTDIQRSLPKGHALLVFVATTSTRPTPSS